MNIITIFCAHIKLLMTSIRRYTILSTNSKFNSFDSEIFQLWKKPTPFSSPPPNNFSDSSDFFLSSINQEQESSTESPKKKLYCPPLVLSNNKIQTKRTKKRNFLFRRITLVSSTKISIPDELNNLVTYFYKGDENQQYAINDFFKKLKYNSIAVIAIANIVISFFNGNIQGKGITGTAQKKLFEISSDLENIDQKKFHTLINDLSKAERIEIYSSFEFFYSTNIPIRIDNQDYQGKNGILHRYILTGYILANKYNAVMSNPQISSIHQDFSLIY